MLESTIDFEKRHSTTSAAIILAIVIVAAYSPIVFLDESYNHSTPIPPEFLGYNGKSTIFGNTVDVPANTQAIPPALKLASELLTEGKIPLWNPYIGVGQPLAADSTYHIFSPFMLEFLMPVKYWDIPLLTILWVAGIFTFLLLRNFGLNFTSSVSGATFYILSGGFTWYLTNPNPVVMAFTPFILYSIEKIIHNDNPKYIVIGSVALALALLGSHLESITLQFLLVGSYLFYRFGSLVLSNYQNKRFKFLDKKPNVVYDTKRIFSWTVLALVGGLGLSAFLIFPVYEFIGNNHLEHGPETGPHYANPISLPSTFIPYILGELHAYWTQDIVGISLWGYVGIFALFFSIVGLYMALKGISKVHRFTPVFFIIVSAFFIMKVYGVPIVNWIGYLPILNLIDFTSYSGVIIPFGFAVAAAFGINYITKVQIKTKVLGLSLLVSISILLLLLIPVFPHVFSAAAKFPTQVTANDARNYVSFQVLQALVFAFMVFLFSVAVSKNKSAIVGIIPLILLELSLYVPLGLHPLWMAYKSVIVISAMTVVTVLFLKPPRFAYHVTEIGKIRFYILIGVLVAAFGGEVLLSEMSPFGMMEKYDSFQSDPVTSFLKANLGNYRMFSFDYTLGPNYPEAYKIATLGQFASFNINSFYSFIHNFLDPQADTSRFGYPAWTYTYGPMTSIDKFFTNKKYFDFLGVKYIVTEGYNFNSIAAGVPGLSGQFTKINSSDNSTGQSFISPVNTITGIGVSLGTLSQNPGKIILTLDSVPRDEKYHREATINSTINQQFNEFNIVPPLDGIANKTLYFSLKYPETQIDTLAVVFTIEKNQSGYDYIKNKLQGKFYENGLQIEDKEIVFSITTDVNKYPSSFKFHNIYVYENKDAYPRTFLVKKYQVVEKGNAQNFLVNNPLFDLRNEVILENPLPAAWADSFKSSVFGQNSTVTIVSYTANKVLINTNSSSASLLILTDVYYPGWKAYVDGQESKIYRADGLVRTIFVPDGSHTVEFSYEPKSFMIGIIISLITAVILVGVLFYSKKKNFNLRNYSAQLNNYNDIIS